jgi:hypothetical protein
LYFTVTVPAPAGFGDITAKTEAASGVTGQMINLIIIGTAPELSRARSSKADSGGRKTQTPRRPANRPRNLPRHQKATMTATLSMRTPAQHVWRDPSAQLTIKRQRQTEECSSKVQQPCRTAATHVTVKVLRPASKTSMDRVVSTAAEN